MSKPFILQQEGSRWALYLEPDAARRYGGSTTKRRLEKYGSERLAVVLDLDGRVKKLDPGGRATRSTKSDLMQTAHTLGYMMGLGDFTDTYTEVRHEPKTEGDRRRRHRTAGAPTFATQRYISRKIRKLRHEGYPPKQAEAIAYRYAEARRKPARKTSRRRASRSRSR